MKPASEIGALQKIVEQNDIMIALLRDLNEKLAWQNNYLHARGGK